MSWLMSELSEILDELRAIRRAIEQITDQMPVATEHGDALVNRHNEIVGFVDEPHVRLARLEAQRRARS